MQKNKRTLGIIAAAVIVVLAVIIIWGIQVFSNKKTVNSDSGTKEDNVIDLTGYNNSGDITIESATKVLDESGEIIGYLVTVLSKTHNQSIRMEATLHKTGTILQSLKILDPGKADPVITQENFLNQFIQLTVPISLTDITYEESSEELNTIDNSTEQADSETTDAAEGTASENTETEVSPSLKNGDYTAEADNFDKEGFKDKVTLSVENGTITEVKWDAYNADGELKSVLSADGLYELAEGGSTWQEQATAAADYVVQHQNVDSIVMKADGSTDSVSGVSIPVDTFVALIKNCLEQAAAGNTVSSAAKDTLESNGTKESAEGNPDAENSLSSSEETTAEDGTSDNRTASINALIDGINKAGSFITEYVLAE